MTPDQRGLAYEDIIFETQDKVKLNGWFLPGNQKSPYFLFCHGNAGNISHRIDNLILLHRIGLSVFIFDYRGYGKSTGKISEAGLYLDAEAAYQYTAKKASENNNPIVIFGRSLGTIAAVHVATANKCAGVILESAFTCLEDMAAYHYPLPFLSRLLKGRFDNIAGIKRLHQPTLFIHGDRDTSVPYKMGQTLFEAVDAPKAFYTIPCAGHNDTYDIAGAKYTEVLDQFIRDAVSGKREGEKMNIEHRTLNGKGCTILYRKQRI
jgi:fermentation-respiration switch protein FrsA (DUF1100 family)